MIYSWLKKCARFTCKDFVDCSDYWDSAVEMVETVETVDTHTLFVIVSTPPYFLGLQEVDQKSA